MHFVQHCLYFLVGIFTDKDILTFTAYSSTTWHHKFPPMYMYKSIPQTLLSLWYWKNNIQKITSRHDNWPLTKWTARFWASLNRTNRSKLTSITNEITVKSTGMVSIATTLQQGNTYTWVETWNRKKVSFCFLLLYM